MLLLYVFVRLTAWLITWMLIAFAVILMVIWTVLCVIAAAVVDPASWRSAPRRQQSIKNPRMYYSSRR